MGLFCTHSGFDCENEYGSLSFWQELIHANKAMKGKMLSTKTGNTIDPDNADNFKQFLSPEEIHTRKEENIIRGENREKLRAEPEVR